MAKSKPDLEKIQSDVAEFASSLGLSSSLPSSGFNDSDFRPKKNSKPPQNAKPQIPKPPNTTPLPKNPKPHLKKPQFEKPKIEDVVPKSSFDKYKNLPKLPLVKASALGSWHVNQEELEGKVMGGKTGRVETGGDADEWKKLVAKKKELGERLLAQYSVDYEGTRGQSSDIKMLITTQRSGTATDKVSAYSVLIGDNPIANIRSLDALLGMVFI